MISLLIRNGRIIDGAGSPACDADLAVSGDRVARIAPRIDEAAENTIDATGLVVAPGFIDMHAHGGDLVLENRTADSKVHDGVTTEVLGNCGGSAFPTHKEKNGCRSAAEFFAAVGEAGTSINRAFLAGMGSIRTFVMGPGAEPASAQDIKAMRDELARCIEEGAFGVSTGLIYPPGCFTTREEMAEVARAAGEVGGLYATHMRSEGDAIEEAIDEAEFIASTSGARLQISHVKLYGEENWHKIDWLEKRLRQLQDSVDAACDRYPYVAAATDVGIILPNWVHDGGAEARVQRLKEPDTRRRVRGEILAVRNEAYWDKVTISSVPDQADAAFIGKTLRQVGDLAGRHPVDVLLDQLAAHTGMASAVFFTLSEDNLRRILMWPFVAAGSDARARGRLPKDRAERSHPRGYGTFSRLLGRYARELKLLTLEEAVRRMTSLPAQRLGLRDRGVLREGAFADITVFDPEAVADRATFTDPHQFSAGIIHVLVNGQPVIASRLHTDRLAGRVLRRGE